MKRGEKMAAVETPQDEIEQLREDLAEHATHLDLLQQNADSQRTNWAADPFAPIHACPPEGSGIMPCCGCTPFEKIRDRITDDSRLVTCGRK